METEMSHIEKSWLGNLVEKLKERFIGTTKTLKKLAKDDPRRVIHSFKMALALTLVSLFYFVRPLYDGFGISGMWAVLTVVVVFEFSVGATISKGLNRGLATLSAGALGVGAQHLALLFGRKGEPIVLAFLVFLLAAMSTFTRFVPSIKKRYDYGVLIFILTFSLVAVSGYRVDEIIVVAYQRLSTILVGGATCIIVSIFICPVWAGEDLHNLITGNINKLANFLEGFGEHYYTIPDNVAIPMESKLDTKFFQSYRTILASKTNEENLANFARWEPCHGPFRLHYPWKQYVTIGALTRQCAYHIETLCGFVDTDLKAPLEFRRKIKDSCLKMSVESSKALKAMASSIEKMTYPKLVDFHVENSKQAAKELEHVLKSASSYGPENIVTLIADATVASILVNITECVEKISAAIHELAKLAHFKEVEPTVSPEITRSTTKLHRGIVNPMFNEDDSDKVECVDVIICDQKKIQKQETCIEDEIIIDVTDSCTNVHNVVSPGPKITSK